MTLCLISGSFGQYRHWKVSKMSDCWLPPYTFISAALSSQSTQKGVYRIILAYESARLKHFPLLNESLYRFLRGISSYIILPTSERLCQSFESKPANLSRKLVESTCDGSNTDIFSALVHRTAVNWKLSDNWSKISNNVCLFKEMRRGVNAMEGNFTYYVLRFCLPRSWVQLPDINTQFSI